MPTSRTPIHELHKPTWLLHRIALLIGVVAVTAWIGGGAPNRTSIVQSASLANSFGSTPTNAPPGSTVAVYAFYFDPALAGTAVVIQFDGPATVLVHTTMLACDNNRGAGFGTQCNGLALNVTIPPDASVGGHQLLMETDNFANNFRLASAAITVDAKPTQTATPTDTATQTASPTGTASATATATNSATGTLEPSVTPSWTPVVAVRTSTRVATVTPIPTRQKPSSTPTVPSRPPLTAPSIAVSQLQHVQGGCATLTSTASVLRAGAPVGPAANGSPAVFKGGQRLTLEASHLPKKTALDLVVIAPRTVISGRVSTAVDYSPPIVHAHTDAHGILVASVDLPGDLAAGFGKVQAFLHTAPHGATHPTLLTSWSFTAAPRDPVLQVSVRDASGQPMRGASVTFLPNGVTTGTGVSLTAACGRVSNGGGNALFSDVQAGAAQVIVSKGSRFIGSAAPITLSGATVSVRISDSVRSPIQCASLASSRPYLWDEESGGDGASSGDGPFGTFISGVRTMDTFSAVVSSKLGRNTPITLSFVNGNGTAALSVTGFVSQGPPGVIALRSPFVGLDRWNPLTAESGRPSASSDGLVTLHVQSAPINPSRYVLYGGAQPNTLQVSATQFVAFPPVDLGRLAPGNWSVSVTLGSTPSCPSLYPLTMIKNPWETPFGTIHPVFDRVDHAYYASESLPNSGAAAALLHFQQPHVQIGWDAYDVDGIVTVPGVHIPFPELASSDLGVDVNERLFTNGAWDGSLSAHAHVKLIGVSLLDRQLPTFNGSGNQITQDSVPLFEYPAVSNQPLFSVPLAIVPVGFPGVAGAELKVTFNMHGSAYVQLGVGAVLDRVSFTFEPAITGGLEASAHVDFAGQSAGVSLNGALTLQSPVTVAIPGGIHADLAVRFGVGGHAYARFCFITCGGPSVDFTIIPRFCVLGNCSAVPNLAYRTVSTLPGGHLVAGRAAILTMSRSQRVSDGASRGSSTTRQSAHGTVRAAPRSLIYPAQPAIAISPAGHSAALWVSNAGGRVRLLAAMDGGATLAIATSSAQIAGPRVTWIGQNQAIAVWVGNTATAAQIAAVNFTTSRNGFPALAVALSHQEIYSAVWDGRSWSAPRRLTSDRFADSEPAVTGDIVHHSAALAWIHATKSGNLHDVLQATELRVSQYANGRWASAATLVTAMVGGVHSPAIGSDGKGHVMVAWVAGSGMASTTLVAAYVHGAGHPRAIPGLGRGAVHLSLAFDGDGHPVIAADGTELTVARLGPSGRWTVWTLGSGTQPQLIAERDGSLALASLPGTGDPLQPLGVPSLRILPRGGTFGESLNVPGTSGRTIAIAIAADPRTGSLKAIDQTTTAASAHIVDTAMHVAPVVITAGGKLSLVRDGIRLNPPQPRPGTRARLLVTVRNTGFATLPVGGEVVVTVGVSHSTLRLRVPRALAPGATTTLVGNIVAASTGMAVTARVGGQTLRGVLALPPTPFALGSAVLSRSRGLELDWAAAADIDVSTYRVYRGAGANGSLSLAGIASSMQWIDLTRAPRMTYRYQITAVDRYGRESSLSAALVTAAS
ncbi:MAG: repeat protein [Chloroflexi bacterium]|nr:repeat protein [Chloroflexota bacterium]